MLIKLVKSTLQLVKYHFDREKLVENFLTVFEVVQKAKPAAAKGTYMKSVNVATTMGPSVKVDSSSIK